MNVELTKKDIIRLLRGVEPSYDDIWTIKSMGLGFYIGGFEDRFEWQYPNYYVWNNYSEEELFELYQKLTK